MPNDEKTFAEYRELILKGLKENREDHLRIDAKLEKISTDLTVVKVKSGFYGAIAGLVPSIIVAIIMFIKFMNTLNNLPK